MVKVKNQVPFSDSVTAVWVPKYIKQNQSMRAKDVVTSSDWNNLFNLVIAQGDWNSEAINKLINTGDFGIQFAAHAEDSDKLGGKLPAYYTEYADNVLEQSAEMFNEAKRYTDEVVTRIGAADMLMSTYDTNRDGIVDNAEALGGVPAETINNDIDLLKHNVNDLQNNKVNKSEMTILTANKADKTLGNVDNTTFKNKIIASGYDSHTAGDIVFSYTDLAKTHPGKYLELNGQMFSKDDYPAIRGFFSNTGVVAAMGTYVTSNTINAGSVGAMYDSGAYDEYIGASNEDGSFIVFASLYRKDYSRNIRYIIVSSSDNGKTLKSTGYKDFATSMKDPVCAIVGNKCIILYVDESDRSSSYYGSLYAIVSTNGGASWTTPTNTGLAFGNSPKLVGAGNNFILLWENSVYSLNVNSLVKGTEWSELSLPVVQKSYNLSHFTGSTKVVIGRFSKYDSTAEKGVLIDLSNMSMKAITFPTKTANPNVSMYDRNCISTASNDGYYWVIDNNSSVFYARTKDFITWNYGNLGEENNRFDYDFTTLMLGKLFNSSWVLCSYCLVDGSTSGTRAIGTLTLNSLQPLGTEVNVSTFLGSNCDNFRGISPIIDGSYCIFIYRTHTHTDVQYTVRKFAFRDVNTHKQLPNISAQPTTHGTNRRPYIRVV